MAGPAAAGAKAHVFVVDVGAPELDAGDRHHLERVLRLRPGETVTASDGAGRWVTCRFVGGGELAVTARWWWSRPPTRR